MTRHPAPIIVELAANAPAAMLAAVEEAIRVVAPLAAVELVRVPPQPEAAWDAPVATGRPQYRAMAALAAAFEAALAAACDSGDRA